MTDLFVCPKMDPPDCPNVGLLPNPPLRNEEPVGDAWPKNDVEVWPNMFGLALALPWPNTVGAVVVEVFCPNMLVLAAVVAAGCPKTLPPLCPKPDGLHMGCPKNEPLDVVAGASELTGCPNMLVVF